MLQIIQVEFKAAQHLLHRVGVAVVESGIGSDTGTNLIEIGVAVVVLHDLLDEIFALGTWTDERHLAFQHIPQLWQLVEVMATQELSDFGHTRFVLVLIECRAVFLGIHAHRAELVDVERSSETSDAFLFEDGRSAILTLHGEVANQEER